MARYVVDTGIVTGWTGHDTFYSTGAKPSSATVNLSVDTFDTTPGSTSIFAENTDGLASGTVQIETRLEASEVCAPGSGESLVTFANGYDDEVRSWEMSITRPALEVTSDGDAAVVARTYLPGLASWSGSYTANADDSTAATVGAASGAATFFIRSDTTDHTLAGTINLTGQTIPVTIGQVATLTYPFIGTGALTAAGSSDSNTPLWSAGAITFPAADTLTITATSGQTYAGTAFITGLTIRAEIGQPLTLSITAQFSGAVTAG